VFSKSPALSSHPRLRRPGNRAFALSISLAFGESIQLKLSQPMRAILANFISLLLLAAEVTLVLALPVSRGISWPVGILIYVVLACAALYVWHNNKFYDTTPSGWLIFAAVSIPGAAISFAIDVLVGSSVMHGPAHSFLEAAEHAGSPFGFLMTILICPCFTMLAVAGSIRALILSNDLATVRS
jgi:hypothetical protein